VSEVDVAFSTKMSASESATSPLQELPTPNLQKAHPTSAKSFRRTNLRGKREHRSARIRIHRRAVADDEQRRVS
jgi:hypothetical protein